MYTLIRNSPPPQLKEASIYVLIFPYLLSFIPFLKKNSRHSVFCFPVIMILPAFPFWWGLFSPCELWTVFLSFDAVLPTFNLGLCFVSMAPLNFKWFCHSSNNYPKFVKGNEYVSARVVLTLFKWLCKCSHPRLNKNKPSSALIAWVGGLWLWAQVLCWYPNPISQLAGLCISSQAGLICCI